MKQKSNQLELFPELNWKEYKYQGKTYRRYNGGDAPYRKKVENETLSTANANNFISRGMVHTHWCSGKSNAYRPLTWSLICSSLPASPVVT